MRISNLSRELMLNNSTNSSYIPSIIGAMEQYIADYYTLEKQFPSKTTRTEYLSCNLEDMAIKLIYSVYKLQCSSNGITLQQLVTTYAKAIDALGYVEDMKLALDIIQKCDNIIYYLVPTGTFYMVQIKVKLGEIYLPDIYPMPSKDLPNEWTKNNNDINDEYHKHIITGSSFNHHNNQVREDTINLLQGVKYNLTPMLNIDEKVCYTDDALKQWEIFNSQRSDVIKELGSDPFYFYWQYDKRGRMYSNGYHINIQSNEYGKSLLEFNNKEVCTPRGMYWLGICIANHYGLDKKSFKERDEWFQSNKDNLISNPDDYILQADEPYLMKEAIRNYKLALEGKPIGYIARLDSTSSGVQLASVLTRDVEAMKLVNVLNTDRRDIYTDIAQRLLSSGHTLLGDNLKDIRSIIKKPIMTYFYGSKANPRDTLKDSYDAFVSILESTFKGATKLMYVCEDLYRKSPKDVYQWELYDGFTSYCPSIVSKNIRLQSTLSSKLSMNVIINNNEYSADNYRSLAPNVIHSVDAFVCRHIVNSCLNPIGDKPKIDISPIHDSFGVHPNHCDRLREAYRNTLVYLYRNDTLKDILSQLGANISLPDVDNSIAEAILSNTEGHYIC